jgi:hypothetical protein
VSELGSEGAVVSDVEKMLPVMIREPIRTVIADAIDFTVSNSLQKMFAGRNVLTADAECNICGGSGRERRIADNMDGTFTDYGETGKWCRCVRAEAK